MRNIKKITTGAVCSVGVIIGIVMSDYRDEIRTSKAGLELIGNAEGCRREPYLCPAGVLTVGIGSTTDTDKKYYSDDEIAKIWVKNIQQAEQCVNQHGNGKSLPQSVFDAAVSLTFTTGCKKVKHSTLFNYLRENQYENACNRFPDWNKSSGKILNGLVMRREKEKALCLSGL